MAFEPVEEERTPPFKLRLAAYLQYTAGTFSLVLGFALFLLATNWLAKSDTKHLNYSTDLAFTIGILTGILQVGSTLIVCFLGLRSHWICFFWFTFASFLGSLTVFIFSIIENQTPEAPNARDLDKEEVCVIIVSGLDFGFGLLFLIISFIEKVTRFAEVPFTSLD